MTIDPGDWKAPRNTSPDPFSALTAAVRELKDRVASIERGAPLRAAGIRVTPTGLIVDSSLKVTGSQEVAGSLQVTGDLAVDGNFSLPSGSVQSEWLQNQISAGEGSTTTSAFKWTGAMATRMTVNLAVPTWATSAIVIASASLHVIAAVFSYLEIRTAITGVAGQVVTTGLATEGASAGPISGTIIQQRLVTSLGATLPVTFQVNGSNCTYTASAANNTASLYATATFLR